jgi:invasion protein IalB
MYRVILCVASTLLVATAVQRATADDTAVCPPAMGEEAIAACIRMLALNPKNAVIFRNGDYDDAISDEEQAIRLDPKRAIAYNTRGDAYDHKGDHDHAIADFDQTLNLAQHPNDAVLGTPGRNFAPSVPSLRFAAQSAAATPAAQFPNGASSLSETYGGWIISCRLVDGQKRCLLIYAQGNSQTRQRIFEIDLQPPRDGKFEGTILMPFGLKLDTGALLTLDEKDFGPRLRFSTCVPQGCMLPVSWQRAAIDAMKKAKALTVASLNVDNGEVVTFKVSLDGFAPAIARVEELGK